MNSLRDIVELSPQLRDIETQAMYGLQGQDAAQPLAPPRWDWFVGVPSTETRAGGSSSGEDGARGASIRDLADGLTVSAFEAASSASRVTRTGCSPDPEHFAPSWLWVARSRFFGVSLFSRPQVGQTP